MVCKPKHIYQFKITLEEVEPQIWRRIQVPEKYSFWDLHVAIQDAMNWTDSHLHQFDIVNPKNDKEVHIGIPDDEGLIEYLPTTIAGWEEFIGDYFSEKNHSCYYNYDFGNNWIHKIELEKIVQAVPACKYPICVAGERACPPEDCGGVCGYKNFLEIINDPQHEEYERMLEWIGDDFDSEKFDPQKVRFDNPKKRLQIILE